MTDKVTTKMFQDEQAITFHHLSDDDALANHEILDRLFRSLSVEQLHAELGWLQGKYPDG